MEQVKTRALKGSPPLAGGIGSLAGRPSPALPWPLALARGAAKGDVHAPCDPATATPGPPPFGVERRLVRRAEALWDQLRGDSDLPVAAAATLFASPPFADHSLELTFPPDPDGKHPPLPHLGRIGEALTGLGLLGPGPVAPDARPDAPLRERLAALSEQALRLRTPAFLETDTTRQGPSNPEAARGILLRAVALPFRPPRGQPARGPTAIVVASCRQLLSEVETQALHGELAAAIDWLKGLA